MNESAHLKKALGSFDMQFFKRMRLAKPINQPRNFWRDESAVTVIEFAFIGPLFFFMLFSVLETGAVLFTEYVLQTSVQGAARIVRTGQAQEQKMTAALFKSKICELVGNTMDCNGKVTVYMRAENNFTTLAANTPSYLTIGPGSDPANPDSIGNPAPAPSMYKCGTPSQAVALIATYDWDFLVIPSWSVKHFMGNRNSGKTRRMSAFAIFKNEPFPTVPGNVCP
jgi:Flp pilus assembly protein TadG